MTRRSQHKARLDEAIIVDELGLESGGYGIYRLRCLYQPIFERRDLSMHAVAVEGTAAPYVAGEEVPSDVFLAAAADEDLAFIAEMGFTLPLRNLRNIGPEGLELLVGDIAEEGAPYAALDRIRFIAGELAEAGLDPGQVVCAIRGGATPDETMLARLAREIRKAGMRAAIDDFGMGRWTDGQMNVLGADFVRIDGEWFGKVCRDAVTIRLFESVVARLHERRAKVLVSGIASEQQFGVALKAGADLFQGAHLAPLAHVGTEFVETLSVRQKLGSARKIVPLFG